MGKTTKDKAKKAQWHRINTARDFKESHTAGGRIQGQRPHLHRHR